MNILAIVLVCLGMLAAPSVPSYPPVDVSQLAISVEAEHAYAKHFAQAHHDPSFTYLGTAYGASPYCAYRVNGHVLESICYQAATAAIISEADATIKIMHFVYPIKVPYGHNRALLEE